MSLDPSTFEYLTPTWEQLEAMARMRSAFKSIADMIEKEVPAGADREYALRELRTVSMWVNVALTRKGDGSPRLDNHAEVTKFPGYVEALDFVTRG